MALGLLGMVHHLLHDFDSAILKYHEVRFFSGWARDPRTNRLDRH
jgi:hypothetical protein